MHCYFVKKILSVAASSIDNWTGFTCEYLKNDATFEEIKGYSKELVGRISFLLRLARNLGMDSIFTGPLNVVDQELIKEKSECCTGLIENFLALATFLEKIDLNKVELTLEHSQAIQEFIKIQKEK